MKALHKFGAVLIALVLGGSGAAFAVATTNGEHVSCNTATATAPGYTLPEHVIADNGTGVYTIPGHVQPDATAVATACVTATDQTVTVTTTTQTPPTPTVGNGKILFRYGSSYGATQTTAGQGYDRYGFVVVGFGDDAKAVALPTAKALTYKTMAETMNGCASSDTCLSGVSSSDALSAGLLLKNASGALLSGSAAGGSYNIGDFGSAAYQNLWVQKVSARLTSQGLDGVFIDNVLCDPINELVSNGPAAKYPTLADERAAALSFVQSVGSQMRAQGFYVLTNTFCWGDGTAASNDAWWTQTAPSLSGLVTETFEQNPSGSNYNDVRYDSPTTSWMGDWKARLNVLDIAQAAGRDAFAISSAVTGSSAAARYSAASFYLKWNGQGGGYGVGTGGTDPFDASWAYSLGAPTGSMTASGVAFYRLFANGKVIVNPSPTSTVTVLGVTLSPKTAYIGA